MEDNRFLGRLSSPGYIASAKDVERRWYWQKYLVCISLTIQANNNPKSFWATFYFIVNSSLLLTQGLWNLDSQILWKLFRHHRRLVSLPDGLFKNFKQSVPCFSHVPVHSFLEQVLTYSLISDLFPPSPSPVSQLASQRIKVSPFLFLTSLAKVSPSSPHD